MNDNSIKKILILAANPIDSVRLSLEREVAEIRTTLQLSVNRDRFGIEPRGAVRPDDLQQYMYDVQPQIVHFSGHGIGSGDTSEDLPSSRKFTVIADDDVQPEGLMFEDDKGRSTLVSGTALANLCALFSKQVECVVLNSCYSIEQAQEIVKYIPYVVGMNRAIGDIAARKFSQGFYRAIWDDRSIEEAFASGKNAIELDGIPEELTPVLLTGLITSPVVRFKPIDLELDQPDGLVGLNSPFYIERPPVETRCYEAIERKGALIRIKAPRQMGKSSLLIRILDRATQLDYKKVYLNFERAKSLFTDLDKLLLWFCASVGQQLGLPRKFDEYWDNEIFTSVDNCTNYLQSYLLKSIKNPTILVIDEVDLIFQYPIICHDFFGLLRIWHESTKYNSNWENLRIIVLHSQEISTPVDINQSPFNVGMCIELFEFDHIQVEKLAAKHQLELSIIEIKELMAMVGGHPYLIRVAFYHIKYQYISLHKLLQVAPTEAGLFTAHLRGHLDRLHQNNLILAMQQVVASENPVRLSAYEALQLDGMGLILRQRNDVIPRCNLYRLYFRDRLGVNG